MAKKFNKKFKPATIRDMARRRGLAISKAAYSGWYVTLLSLNGPSPVLYCSHSWDRVVKFIKKQPILVLRLVLRSETDE